MREPLVDLPGISGGVSLSHSPTMTSQQAACTPPRLFKWKLGEQQVADVVAKAGIHQSGVSRHLRILHDSGFVEVRPDGQRRFYALRPAPFRQLDGWLTPYRELWAARLDRFGAALEERSKHRRAKENPERKKRS